MEADGSDAGDLPTAEECKASWQCPPDQEGWHITHAALRADMRLVTEALRALRRTLNSQKPLQAWQITAVKSFWAQFNQNVLRHHIQEEDHETIAAMQVQLTANIRRLDVDDDRLACKTLLSEFMASFAEYEALLVEHLEEEERDLVPAMRRSFTQQEERGVLSEAIEHGATHELAAILWHLPPAERRRFLKKAGIPKMRQWLAVRPSVKQYDRLFMRPVAAVIADAVPLPDLDL